LFGLLGTPSHNHIRPDRVLFQTCITQEPSPIPPRVAEAIYVHGTFVASGAHPEFVYHSLRAAFRDFEQAARAGYAGAWFRLGRDYENFTHAIDCFERGVKLNVESCCYVSLSVFFFFVFLVMLNSPRQHMGMAHLMGQLGLPQNFEKAIPLLHHAATLATIDVPQPAYIYGLLLSEFTQINVPLSFFQPFTTVPIEARKHLE
jgi:hypothetical protein